MAPATVRAQGARHLTEENPMTVTVRTSHALSPRSPGPARDSNVSCRQCWCTRHTPQPGHTYRGGDVSSEAVGARG